MLKGSADVKQVSPYCLCAVSKDPQVLHGEEPPPGPAQPARTQDWLRLHRDVHMVNGSIPNAKEA